MPVHHCPISTKHHNPWAGVNPVHTARKAICIYLRRLGARSNARAPQTSEWDKQLTLMLLAATYFSSVTCLSPHIHKRTRGRRWNQTQGHMHHGSGRPLMCIKLSSASELGAAFGHKQTR